MIGASVILLGLGFTTRRLARRLLLRGCAVYATAREEDRFRDLASIGLRFTQLPPGATLVHTIPPLSEHENASVRESIGGLRPRRIVYISSTSVYGKQSEVNSTTAVEASDPKGLLRLAEEGWLASGEWETLVVRPAAIYGPGRGVHSRLMKGESPRVSGSGVVSRIHVDDLAAILEAGITSELMGAWPLADDLPCSSDQIQQFCLQLLRAKSRYEPAEQISVSGRKVDGTALREALGVSLAYPTYESGILASLAESGR